MFVKILFSPMSGQADSSGNLEIKEQYIM